MIVTARKIRVSFSQSFPLRQVFAEAYDRLISASSVEPTSTPIVAMGP